MAGGVKQLWKPQDVAFRLNVPVSWVYKYASVGLIPRVPIPGRLLRFDPEVIERLASEPSSLTTKEKGTKANHRPKKEVLW